MTDPAQVGGTDDLTLQLAWPPDLGAQALPVNQVAFAWDQNHRDVVYMYLGHVAQPLWLTSDIARQRAAETGNTLMVQPRGAFVIGRERAEEIWQALGTHLGKLPHA